MRKPDREIWRDDADFAGVTCPDCGADRVSVVSLFGGAASEVLLQCEACRSCFNWVKWRGKLPPSAHDER